jgi:hypothetical protein
LHNPLALEPDQHNLSPRLAQEQDAKCRFPMGIHTLQQGTLQMRVQLTFLLNMLLPTTIEQLRQAFLPASTKKHNNNIFHCFHQLMKTSLMPYKEYPQPAIHMNEPRAVNVHLT